MRCQNGCTGCDEEQKKIEEHTYFNSIVSAQNKTQSRLRANEGGSYPNRAEYTCHCVG